MYGSEVMRQYYLNATSEQGWNYTPVYSTHYKKQAVLSQCYDLIGLVFGTSSYEHVFVILGLFDTFIMNNFCELGIL